MPPPADLTRFEPDEARLEEAERRLDSGDLDSEPARRAYAELLALYRASCRDQRRLLETTLACVGDGIAIFDASGRLRITNHAAARLLDAPSALKRGAWRYEDLAKALIAAGASVTTGFDRDTTRSPSDEIRFPDGRVLQIRRNRMADGGEIHVYVDVTSDRRRERALSQALASSAAAATAHAELVAALGHKIRAPLAVMLELARRALGRVRDPTLRQTLEAIHDKGDATVGVLAEMLDRATSDTGDVGIAARPLSILFAEDDPVSQMVGVGLLERLGHRVEPVDDGAPAVAAIASGRHFDVVLMDLFMTTLDGIAATRAIRALPVACRDIPIVGLTASVVRADLDAALAAGMSAVVAKPFDGARLSAVLVQAATERPTAAPSAAAPPDCDEAVIRHLHGALGREAVTAAMRSFLDMMGRHGAELEAALASQPAQAVSRAHRLAGSAAVFGFRRLSDALLELERALRAGETDRARAALVRLPELVSAALHQLAAAA